MTYDQDSYIMGMVTAFCECVAGGCKRLALSPPLTEAAFLRVRDEAYRVIEAHGLCHYHEKNEDAPQDRRWQWTALTPGFLHNLQAKDTLFKDSGKHWASLGNPPATQETRVQSPVWEEPTCCRATKPVHHNC